MTDNRDGVTSTEMDLPKTAIRLKSPRLERSSHPGADDLTS